MPYPSASAVVIHYEEALYQVYAPFTFTFVTSEALGTCVNDLPGVAAWHGAAAGS